MADAIEPHGLKVLLAYCAPISTREGGLRYTQQPLLVTCKYFGPTDI